MNTTRNLLGPFRSMHRTATRLHRLCSSSNCLSIRPSCSTVGASNSAPRKRTVPQDGLNLDHFIRNAESKQRLPRVIPTIAETSSYLTAEDISGQGRRVKYITYGCQMNVSDMEVVRSIMKANDYIETEDLNSADVILLMTCSIREGAEDKVWRELRRIRKITSRHKTVGVLGCMAERVRHSLFEKRGMVDVVAGPDAYRDLPRLLAVSRAGSSAINVQLSVDETYADVAPVRVDLDTKTAFVSIMRGCDNMCTYCVVPFTRGQERSRPIASIEEEVRILSEQGVKQITLLGQNVNSYRDLSETQHPLSEPISTSTVPGFKTVYKAKSGGLTFASLLERISRIDPEMRIRFTSPHPKDFPKEVIELIKDRANISNQLHLPAQSGDDETLERMGRGYTRDAYLRLVDDIRSIIPDVALTSDFIAGFCGETEEAHRRTVELIRQVKYDFCYAFPYSMRGKTRAAHRLSDDVPEDVKARRHEELIAAFRDEALKLHEEMKDTVQLALVEGTSKRSSDQVQGRVDGGTKVIFDNTNSFQTGDYVAVKILSATSQSLLGEAIAKTTLQNFYKGAM